MNNQWQDNLRSRMERHEEPAPEGLWNSIEQIMSAETIPAKRNIIPLWSLRIGAAAAAALILFFIGLRTLNVNENREDIRTAEQVQKEQSVPDTPSFDKEPVAKTEEQHVERSKKRRQIKFVIVRHVVQFANHFVEFGKFVVFQLQNQK